MQKVNYNDAIKRAVATKRARIFIKVAKWCVPHYSPDMTQQRSLSEQNVCCEPIDICYIERSACLKDVNTYNDFNFHVGVEKQNGAPIYVSVGFQGRNWRMNQELEIDLLVGLLVI